MRNPTRRVINIPLGTSGSAEGVQISEQSTVTPAGVKSMTQWVFLSMSKEFSDLSDFGGGVERDDPNPEDDVNQLLSDWFVRNGSKVYWDRDQSYGHGTFEITTRRRPDLVVVGDANTYAIEVKRGEKSGNLYKATTQALEYWIDIETGAAEYTCAGEPVEIEALLIATRFSPEGHLFHNQQQKDPKRPGRGKDSARAADGGYIPEVEHTASETLVRTMYRMAEFVGEDADEIDGKTGIGGLYSSALDGDTPGRATSVPAAFFIAPGRGQHASNWDYIPFHKKGDV